MKSFGSFLMILILMALVIGAADYFLLPKIADGQPSLWIWVSLLFLFLITTIVHYALLKAGEGRPTRFVTYFMGATTFKMFLSLAFIVVMLKFGGGHVKVHAVHFLVVYMSLMVVEVTTLLKALQQQA